MTARIAFAAMTLMAAACTTAPAPVAVTPEGVFPRVIPTVDGAVYIPSKGHQGAYDSIGYAPARRAGDTVYISGVIVGRAPDDGNDVAAFKTQARRAFDHLAHVLETAGLGWENVTMINSFHVWDSPHFAGTREEHINALVEVKNEFMKPPHPAWTAVGTTGLLEPTGLVEIQLIAHVPPAGGK
jgi:enamine deaminase RidA (YjgF/YER057c/UK114 family)